MNKPKNTPYALLLIIAIIVALGYAGSASAIVPVIENVVVWSSGSDTVLNVTVFHTPETSLHHVDSVEVNVSGSILSFPVAVQTTETFVIQCDLGQIQTNITASVRAHCTVDGYCEWYGPIQIPEFSPTITLLMLLLVASFAVTGLCKSRLGNHHGAS
jgi:hypothetical protein